MTWEVLATCGLGSLFFYQGMRLGRILLRQGATANDLFKGKPLLSLAFLASYILLVVLALNVPQMQIFPLEWRVAGMQVTWTALRVLLLGFSGMAFTVSWHTARVQVVAIALLAALGLGSFTAAEAYFLAPIHSSLVDNLRPNGVFRQSSASSCAPAALATVFQRLGVDASETSIAKLAGTSRLGTSMPQLIIAARALGWDGVELSPTWEQMQHMNRLAVLGVWLFDGVSQRPHAVALLEITAERAVIGDPAIGRILSLDRTQFARIWRGEYVPIFRPSELALTDGQVQAHLTRLGYWRSPQTDWRSALRQFQQDMGMKSTAQLDPQTRLLLIGKEKNGAETA